MKATLRCFHTVPQRNKSNTPWTDGQSFRSTRSWSGMFDSANSAAGRAITDSARADAAEEKIQCKVCGNVKVREETFTDLVVPVPTEKEAKASGSVPTAQKLLDERLNQSCVLRSLGEKHPSQDMVCASFACA